MKKEEEGLMEFIRWWNHEQNQVFSSIGRFIIKYSKRFTSTVIHFDTSDSKIPKVGNEIRVWHDRVSRSWRSKNTLLEHSRRFFYSIEYRGTFQNVLKSVFFGSITLFTTKFYHLFQLLFFLLGSGYWWWLVIS